MVQAVTWAMWGATDGLPTCWPLTSYFSEQLLWFAPGTGDPGIEDNLV